MNKEPLMIELDGVADRQLDRIAEALESIAESLKKLSDKKEETDVDLT